MSGRHETELSPLPLSRFYRHIRQITYFEMSGGSAKICQQPSFKT